MKAEKSHKCPEGCSQCANVVPARQRISNPQKKYCQHINCNRKEKALSSPGDARKHERRAHTCPVECTICHPQGTINICYLNLQQIIVVTST